MLSLAAQRPDLNLLGVDIRHKVDPEAPLHWQGLAIMALHLCISRGRSTHSIHVCCMAALVETSPRLLGAHVCCMAALAVTGQCARGLRPTPMQSLVLEVPKQPQHAVPAPCSEALRCKTLSAPGGRLAYPMAPLRQAGLTQCVAATLSLCSSESCLPLHLLLCTSEAHACCCMRTPIAALNCCSWWTEATSGRA